MYYTNKGIFSRFFLKDFSIMLVMHQGLFCTVTLKNAFVIFSDNSVSTQIHRTYIFLFRNI